MRSPRPTRREPLDWGCQRHAVLGVPAPTPRALSAKRFESLLAALHGACASLAWEPSRSEWVDYDTGDSYSESGDRDKMDLANPSPALGWAHRERFSLAQRSSADLVLALALIHHLAIANNVPLPDVAEFFASLAPRLVVEFVPKSDPKLQVLLATREDIFPDYTQPGFERAFAARFEIVERRGLAGSGRVIYLMRRIG